MENKLIDRIADLFNTQQFPEGHTTLDEYLDDVIGIVKGNSDDLREESVYTNKPWVEVRDDENFHELVFHFFSPQPAEDEDKEYLKTVDGEVEQGKWRYVGNKLFIGDEDYDKTKVYELAFLDGEFMILKLLANPKKLSEDNTSKYFVLAAEKIGRKLEWLDLVKHLFEKYQSNNLTYYLVAIFIVLIALILVS